MVLFSEFGHEYVPWDVQADSLEFLKKLPRCPLAAPAFHLTWERWTKGTKLGSKSRVLSGRTDLAPRESACLIEVIVELRTKLVNDVHQLI
jgi:hypothetical protein